MYEYKARVLNVVDGDTYDVDIDLGFHIHIHERIRVLDLDTPEKFGEERELGRIVREYAEAMLATAMRLLAPLGLTLEVVSASGSKVVPVSRDDGGETPHAEVAQ